METKNERAVCPRCHHVVPMKFHFPAPRSDECEETYAWRFQHCPVCKWSGDVVTGRYMNLYRYHWILFVDGEEFPRGLRQLLEELELCPPLG
jgi:hypothetical protein